MLLLLLAVAAEPAPRYRVVDRDAAPACYETVSRPPQEQSEIFVRYAAALKLAHTQDDKARIEAVRLLETIATDAAWLVQAHRAIAQVHVDRGQWLSAYVVFKRYLHFDLHPSDREAARAQLSALEQREPALADYAASERAAQKGAYAEAQRLAERVTAAKGSFPLAFRLLGITYAATGRAAESAAAYERYLELDVFAVDRSAVQTIVAQTRAALKARP